MIVVRFKYENQFQQFQQFHIHKVGAVGRWNLSFNDLFFCNYCYFD